MTPEDYVADILGEAATQLPELNSGDKEFVLSQVNRAMTIFLDQCSLGQPVATRNTIRNARNGDEMVSAGFSLQEIVDADPSIVGRSMGIARSEILATIADDFAAFRKQAGSGIPNFSIN